MAIIRVEKTKNYTVMSNQHLRDPELSLSARGLMSLMLSLPDDWDFTISGLQTLCKEGSQVIRRCLSEMENAGYLKRERVSGAGGRFTYDYTLTELPNTAYGSPYSGKPHTVKPHTVEPCTVNLPQLSTDLQSTDLQNTDIRNTKNVFWDKPQTTRKASRFIQPSAEEVECYCRERKNGIDSQKFIDYYTARGWMIGKNKMKDWKAAVRTWERSGYNDKPRQQYQSNGSPLQKVKREDYDTDEMPW